MVVSKLEFRKLYKYTHPTDPMSWYLFVLSIDNPVYPECRVEDFSNVTYLSVGDTFQMVLPLDLLQVREVDTWPRSNSLLYGNSNHVLQSTPSIPAGNQSRQSSAQVGPPPPKFQGGDWAEYRGPSTQELTHGNKYKVLYAITMNNMDLILLENDYGASLYYQAQDFTHSSGTRPSLPNIGGPFLPFRSPPMVVPLTGCNHESMQYTGFNSATTTICRKCGVSL